MLFNLLLFCKSIDVIASQSINAEFDIVTRLLLLASIDVIVELLEPSILNASSPIS